MSAQNLHNISLDCIVPSKDNARKIDQDSEGFKDLVRSIKAGGVRVPIHIRSCPGKPCKYEIRAGERRWRACKSLGRKTIPAIVHSDMDDATALDLTYIENKFREDLKPLEEVAEIGRCMDRLGDNAKLIAEKIGQTEQWVRLRANIHKNLHQAWRQVFLNLGIEDDMGLWTVAHLTLVARLPGNIQKDLLESIRKNRLSWDRNISVKELESRIAEKLKLLSKAKWNLEDETLLPKASACSKCTKRSGVQPVLWFGAIDDQIKSKDRCLDPYCWENKLTAYLQQRAKELSEKHSNLIYVTAEYPDSSEKEFLSKTFGRVLDESDTIKSTKSAKGSLPALVVHGKGTGMIIYVKEKQYAKTAPGRVAGRITPLKERKQLLDCKRWAQVLRELREKVEATGVDQIIYIDKITGIMALTALYGNKPLWSLEEPSRLRNLDSSDKVLQKQIDDLVKKADKDMSEITKTRKKALELLWDSVKPTLDDILTYNGPITQTSEHYIVSARWIAKLIQVDINKMFKEVSQQKGFTEPKSWKGLNPDGTPKTKKAKKQKVT